MQSILSFEIGPKLLLNSIKKAQKFFIAEARCNIAQALELSPKLDGPRVIVKAQQSEKVDNAGFFQAALLEPTKEQPRTPFF